MEEKLNSPSDFLTPSAAGAPKVDLMTPSQFTAPPHCSPAVAVPGPSRDERPQGPWVLPPQPASQRHTNPWDAIAEAKQEILELRRENQRMMHLHGTVSGRNQNPQELVNLGSSVPSSAVRMEAEWRLDTERLKAEVERLRGQLEALRDLSARQRDEVREREATLSRQSYELQEARSELGRTKAELNQAAAELNRCKLEQDKLGVQLERLKKKAQEEQERLEKEAERSRLEVQTLRTVMEQERQEMEMASKLEVLQLKEELEKVQEKRKAELQELSLRHQTELSATRQACSELQDRLSTSTQELVGAESSLRQACEEREKLREELSKLGKAFDSQSATLQSLRSYIGQLMPETSQQEQLTIAVQKLESEKGALQETVELQSVRLKSLSDILAMQEKEMEETTLSDPVLKGNHMGHRVLHCWREKVFALLVQLRSRDIELRKERSELVTRISTLEEEAKQQAYQNSVLQHSLLDRKAELDLERVGRQAVEREMTQSRDENAKLKESAHGTKSALKKITEGIKSFSHVFDAKVTEMQAAQCRLFTLAQRLMFAKSRVDTVQGLIMRREALRQLQHTAKAPEPDPTSSLEAELVRLCEERERLAEELKRTPGLIEGALTEARQRFESEVQELKQALQRSRGEMLEAGQSRMHAEQRLREATSQLQEHVESQGRLRAQLASQQEEIAREMKEKLSEVESGCTRRLREMESQLNAARREHTKAVVTLRQCERQAERDRERERDIRLTQEQQTQKELCDLRKLLQEADRDRNLLMATVRENGLLQQYKKARTRARKTSTALTDQQREGSLGKTQASWLNVNPQMKDSVLSVLDDLQALSAVVINSSNDSGEEEEEEEAETADKPLEAAHHRKHVN